MTQIGPLDIAAENILIGLVAAGIVTLISYIRRYIENKVIEYQYPIDGEFVSVFIDEEKGEQSRQVAPVTVEQSGRDITGVTELPNSEQSWVLDGQISKNGYVNGTYEAVNPHDSGMGNFFLHIKPDRTMEGLWSGYDEKNKKINSGMYTFYPVIRNIDIRPPHESELPTMTGILNEQLGRDYITRELVRDSISKDSPLFSLIAVYPTNGDRTSQPIMEMSKKALNTITKKPLDTNKTREPQIVGACLGTVISSNRLEEYFNIECARFPEEIRQSDRVGIVRTVAVREKYQHRGIGTKLVNRCIEQCKERGANVFCAIGWKVNDSVNIGGILNEQGFRRVSEIEDYWSEESVEHGYHCPNCGEPPCSCSGILFVRYGDTVRSVNPSD